MKKYLLVEDDCAPDALEYFIKDMKDKFGIEFNDFTQYGKLIKPDSLTLEWHYQRYVLSYHGDDPVHKLEKRTITEFKKRGVTKC
jgi:hypothetical protein